MTTLLASAGIEQLRKNIGNVRGSLVKYIETVLGGDSVAGACCHPLARWSHKLLCAAEMVLLHMISRV
mgnify:FL=1